MIRYAAVALIGVAAFGQGGVEVASVKPTPPDQWNGYSGGKTQNGHVTMTNVTLKRCIMGAYGLGPNQIFGGPDWLDVDHYDIVAKGEPSVNSDAVLQAVMAERFKLAMHRETRTIPAIVVEVGKGGPKLEKADGEASSTHNGRGLIDAKGTTMARFAEVLSRQMDMPVVDHTGLEGRFNVLLKWTPESAKPADDGNSIFTAIQALGLRLRSAKAPVEVIVIDHAERPSAN